MALTVVATVVGVAGHASAQSKARTETVILGQSDASGTVNLQGFARPIAPGALGPTTMQSSQLSLGGVNVGALSEFASDPTGKAIDPRAHGRSESNVIGGYAGYRFGTAEDPRSGYGINLRFGADPDAGAESWRVQPGFDYAASLGSSWQFNSRIFSTYNMDGSLTGGRSGFANAEDRGFRDVGLSLELGYAPSESWTVQTQATYAVPLRSQDRSRSSEENESSNEFFGGVILNYKF